MTTLNSLIHPLQVRILEEGWILQTITKRPVKRDVRQPD